MSVPHAEALTQGILARTSGSPCGSARDQLSDFTDGTLDALGHRLVAGHLAHCGACADLALVLAGFSQALPPLAAVQAPASLADSIFKITTRRPSKVAAIWWQRPRLALEAAYLAAAAGFVVVSLPMPQPTQALIHRLDLSARKLPDRLSSLKPITQIEFSKLGSNLRRIRGPGSEFLQGRRAQAHTWWAAALARFQAFRQRHFPPRKAESREPAAPPVRSAS